MQSRFFAEGNPLFKKMFQDHPLWHYWSLKQSEWATDIMFQTPEALSSIYPELLTYAIRTFGSPDVMRFLGRRVPTHQGVHRRFAGEIVSDMKSRPEGIRVKHRINANSIKMYDKQGSVLRIETKTTQRQSRLITKKLRLLPAHRLIRKIPHTHRYRLTDKGTQLIATLSATRDLTTQQLFKLAA